LIQRLVILPIVTQQHRLHQAITGSHTTIVPYPSKGLGFAHFHPFTPVKLFNTQKKEQTTPF